MVWNPTPVAPPVGQLGWRAPIYSTLVSPTMLASAMMRAPTLLVALFMDAPSMAATGQMRTPSVMVTPPAQVAPRMQSTAMMLVPGVSSGEGMVAPVMVASAAFLTPTLVSEVMLLAPEMAAAAQALIPDVGIGYPMVAPPMVASAQMLPPSLIVGMGVTLAIPLMAASAQMLAPGLSVGEAMTAPSMAASAGMLAPGVQTGIPLVSPLASASAAMLVPSLSAGALLTAALMTATGQMPTPSVGAGVGMTAPLMAATAAALAPTVGWTADAGISYWATGGGFNGVSNPGVADTFTIAVQEDSYVILDVSTYTAGAAMPAVVTCGGVAMEPLAEKAYNGAAYRHHRYGIYVPEGAGGTKTISFTHSAVYGLYVAMNALAYEGAKAAASTIAQESTGTPSMSAIVGTNEMAVQGFARVSTLVPSGGTNRVNLNNAYCSLSMSDAGASTTFTSTGSEAWHGITTILSTELPLVYHSATGTSQAQVASTTASCTQAAEAGDLVVATVDCQGNWPVTGMTFDSLPMTLLTIQAKNNDLNNGYTAMYGIFAPTTATKTIAVTVSATVGVAVGSVAYTGVGSVVKLPGVYGTNSDTMSHSLVCGADEMIVQAFGCNFELTATGGGTNRHDVQIAGGPANFIMSDAKNSTTFTGAAPFGFQPWAGVGVLLSAKKVEYSAEGTGVAGNNSATITDTCSAVTGDTGYVWVSTDSATIPTSVAWGSKTMTMMATRPHNNNASVGSLYLYKVIEPPTGSQTITVAIPNNDKATIYPIAYSGVVSDEILTVTSGNTSSTSQAATVLPGQFAVQGFGSRNKPFTATSGGTERVRIDGVNNNANLAVIDSSSSATLGTTMSGTGEQSGITLLLKTTAKAELIAYSCGTGNSITIPAGHTTGDTILIIAHQHNRAATIPSLPAGYTTPTGGTAGSINAARVGWKTAASSSETSGTWTNATLMEVFVFRNARVTGGPIGGCAMGNDSITNFPCPAITMANSDGSSIVLTFGSGGDNVNTMAANAISAAAPAGFVPLQRLFSGNRGLFANMKEITTTDGASSQACSANTWGVYGTIEIVSV